MEDFNKYKKQSEPEKIKKAENWGVAIGLQQVDNLTTSKYLIEVAKDNIERIRFLTNNARGDEINPRVYLLGKKKVSISRFLILIVSSWKQRA